MINRMDEAREICDYLLDEIELSIYSINRAMTSRCLNIVSKFCLRRTKKNNNIQEVNLHIDNIKYGLKRLQLDLYDIGESLEGEESKELTKEIDLWIFHVYSDILFQEELVVLKDELTKLRKTVSDFYERLFAVKEFFY